MRRIIAALALSALSLSGKASAQSYAPAYVQAPAPGYYFLAPPPYVVTYQPYNPRYQFEYPFQQARQPNPTGYQNRPYYGAYGYGNYSNGSTDGYPPFRGRGWR